MFRAAAEKTGGRWHDGYDAAVRGNLTGWVLALLLMAGASSASDVEVIYPPQVIMLDEVVGEGPADEDAEGNDAAVVTNDYRVGFEAIKALGMMDMKGATRIELNVFDYLVSRDLFSRRFPYDARPEGNAWLIHEDESNGMARVSIGGLTLLDVTKPNPGKPVNTVALSRNSSTDGIAQVMATWEEADVADDVKKLLRYLDESGEDLNESYRRQEAGAVFMAAAEYYCAGYTNEANGIVTRLFPAVPDRRSLIRTAVGQVADAALARAMAELERSGDWLAYSNALADHITRYGDAWEGGPYVSILHRKISEHIAKPGPPAIEGLTEADRALLAELFRSTHGLFIKPNLDFLMGAPWVLGLTNTVAGTGGRRFPMMISSQKAEPWPFGDALRDRGMTAVPLLIALLEVDTLLPCRAQGSNRDYEDYDDGFRGPAGILKYYRRLPQPWKVSDLARSLLLPLLPPDGETARTATEDNAAIKAKVSAWFEEASGKSREALANDYLEKGHPHQQMAVLTHRMQTETNTAPADIEKAIVVMEPYMQMQMVRQYVTSPAWKGGDFLDRLEARLLNSNGAEKATGMYVEEAAAGFPQPSYRDESGIKRELKELRLLTNQVDFALLFKRVAAREVSSRSVYRLLYSQNAPSARDAAIRDYFAAIELSQGSTEAVTALLELLPSILTMARAGESEDETAEDAAFPEELTNSLRRLLEDSRPLVEKDTFEKGGVATIAEHVAYCIELSLGGGQTLTPIMKAGLDLSLFKQTLKERAIARLQGAKEENLPPLPTGDDVTKERRSDLLDPLKAANDATTAIAILDSLSFDERIALADFFEPQKLKDDLTNGPLPVVANRIVTVTVSPSGETAYAAFTSWVGQTFTPDHVHTALGIITGRVATGRVVTFSVKRTPMLGGVKIHVKDGSIDTELDKLREEARDADVDDRDEDRVDGREPRVLLRLQGANAWANGEIKLEDGVEDKPSGVADPEAGDVEDDDIITDSERLRGRDRTQERLDDFWSNVTNAFSTGRVTVASCELTFNGSPRILAATLKKIRDEIKEAKESSNGSESETESVPSGDPLSRRDPIRNGRLGESAFNMSVGRVSDPASDHGK